MKILAISTDRKILDSESAVSVRQLEYGGFVDEIHIILFSLRGLHLTDKVKISKNVWVYPTASFGKWAYIIDAYFLGRAILRDRGVDLISTQNPFETGIVGWLLSLVRNTKVEMQLHTDPFSPFFIRGHVMNFLRRHMARFLLPKASGIRVVSRRIEDDVRRVLAGRAPPIVVLPIFVDTEKFRSYEPKYNLHDRFPQFDNIVLSLSRLEPEKNIKMAIDAMGEVVKKHPKTGLVIVGDGSQKKKLSAYAESVGVGESVVFTGWVDDVISAFKTADVFLLTSNFEGYAMTLVEAAASGTPVVTTDVGLVGDVLTGGESALVCAPGDYLCAAYHIIEILGDQGLRQRLIKNAHAAIKERVIQTKKDYLDAYKNYWHGIDL